MTFDTFPTGCKVLKNPLDKLPETVLNLNLKIEHVGSRFTKQPINEDSDWDFLILDPELKLDSALKELEFTQEGMQLDYSNMSDFISYRKGVVNLIVTKSEEFFNKFIDATNIAKNLNLQHKCQRVALFQQILYNNPVPADMI